MRGWFGAPSIGAWRETCAKAERAYRSGRFLIERLGAERYLTPELTATLWRRRRGLAEETGARSTAELMLVDLAVLAYADALRVQGWLGSWMLVAEGEAFGQEGLRARFRERYGGGSGEIRGL